MVDLKRCTTQNIRVITKESFGSAGILEKEDLLPLAPAVLPPFTTPKTVIVQVGML